MKISEIQIGMENITVTGEITEVGQPRNVDTRFGPAQVATAILKDESGSVRLNLWRNQIGMVKPGDRVKIEGAFARGFGGEPELNMGQTKGKILVVNNE